MNTCIKCNKVFANSQSLKYHITRNVCDKKKKNKCENCDYVFKTGAMLKYHLEHGVCNNNNKKDIPLKKKIIMKNKFVEKYENYSKEELILKISHLEGEKCFLTENPKIINNINKQQINNIDLFINIVVPPSFLSPDTFENVMRMTPNLLSDATFLEKRYTKNHSHYNFWYTFFLKR